MPLPKKIVVIGPESTGKSTLSEQLAAKFNTEWVPEFARQYLLAIERPYNYDDLLIIARGQLEDEDRLAASVSTPIIIIDTDMYVMKVWCEFVFGKCHRWVLDQIIERKYELYLLCNTDLPWVKDELREYPDLKTRDRLYHIYKDIMINQSTPWVDITGDYDERLQKAIKAVDQLMVG